jgi:hypothetical protein
MRSARRILIALFFIAPLVAGAQSVSTDILMAQVAALKSQLTSLQNKSAVLPGVRVCSVPQRTLKRNDSGDDVANLQIFLARDVVIYPEGTVTGTFGPATERAVQRWQKKLGIVSAGSPATTGFGAVGARTLELLNKAWSCGGLVSTGWFNANVTDGVAQFSAQASSSIPLDSSLYIDTGDNAKEPVSISNAVCKSLGGQCSSVMSAKHAYARGTFTATLRRQQSVQKCLVFPQTCVDGIGICATLPPICSTDTIVETLATTTVASTGASASSAAGAANTSVPGAVSGPPAIRVLTPAKGAVVLAGGSLTISWSGSYAPQNASVSILLRNSAGSIVGTIIKGQRTVGTYWWALPAPSGAPCTADAFTCLMQLATPSCSGDICALSNGTYSIVVQLVANGSVLASAESGTFTVTSSSISIPTGTASTSSSAATGTVASTTSTGAYGAVPAGNTTGTASCIYSGIPYGNNITLQVSCTDLAGISCGNFGLMSLTCKNGTWVDGTGAAANVPNITTNASSSASCTTAWGGQKVQSGQQITYEPFFTGGQYTGNSVVPLMECRAGKWFKCSWDGTGCAAYTTVQ